MIPSFETTSVKWVLQWRSKEAVFNDFKTAESIFKEKLYEGKSPKLFEMRAVLTTTQIA
jgi:hypothetical protein